MTGQERELEMFDYENYFDLLNNINVNGKTEKKGNLTYLSWAWAWGEIKKLYPDTTYKVYENEATGLPYFTDGKTCMVKTSVTCNGIEHVEFLPIMDFKNKSISYDAVTSMDVNKTIQRCLTKACARHGLGLYIYAGEDLPEEELEKANEELLKKAEEGKEKRIEVKKKTFADLCGKTIDEVNEALKGKKDVEGTLDKWLMAKNGGAPIEYTRS